MKRTLSDIINDNTGYACKLGEDPATARRAATDELTCAYQRAKAAGCVWEWQMDDLMSAEFDEPAYPLWYVVLLDGNGKVLTSLGGIDFGRGVSDPWANTKSDEYRIGVEAELALEVEADLAISADRLRIVPRSPYIATDDNTILAVGADQTWYRIGTPFADCQMV